MADNLVSTLLVDTMNSANNITPDSDHVNVIENNMNDSEDDTYMTTSRIKAKLPKFTSSDSDTDKENKCKNPFTSSPQKQPSDDDNSRISSIVPSKKKSRISITTNSDSDTDNENRHKNPSISSPFKQASDDDSRISRTFPSKKSRRRNFSNSDSDIDKKNEDWNPITSSPLKQSLDVDNSLISSTVFTKKSRIKTFSNSESESQPENESTESTSKYDLTRTKIKNKKLKDKFKKLRNTTQSILKVNETAQSELSDGKSSKGSDVSDDENSCLKIKQKLMKKSTYSLASICDPDTSDEESGIKIRQPKSRQKSTKPTSPKPIRQIMSAKQAMENMQKIKSESNRMLREKEVSLPYHRPKALTLKDIMSRRRPAFTSDGKSLPIKMNSEQLKQYASLLEQRHKEMMELCKSDTEEEEDVNSTDKEVSSNVSNKSGNDENCVNTKINEAEENCVVSSEINDKTFDDIIMEEKANETKVSTLHKQIVEESIGINDLVKEDNTEQTKSDNISIASENTIGQEVKNAMNEENLAQNEPLILNQCTEEESQVISLHYDTDKTEVKEAEVDNKKSNANKTDEFHKVINDNGKEKENLTDEFSDNDFTMEELDSILENAEINKDITNKPLSNMQSTMTIKPKLTGGPGMVINLDEDGFNTPRKLTGVELLKERFTYFVKLKSLEDKEKDREKKFKPGIQHLKLKQELEEQIAEQRSLEWEKRLEEEKKLKAEMNEVDIAEEFDGENIEKIEAELEESEAVDEEESSSGEEEDDIDMSEKPRKRNPLVDEEAEVSEDETAKNEEDKCENDNDEENDGSEANGNYSDSEEEDDTSESEEDGQNKPKKGRILKAFEDSDDEEPKSDSIPYNNPKTQNESNIPESQDDDMQLAQQRTFSEDLFTSQECSQKSINMTDKPKDSQNNTSTDNDLGTQTFSILQSGCEYINNAKNTSSEKIDIICETQPCSDDNFEAIVRMCTGNFTENLVTPQSQSSQLSQSQELDDDVAAMCTGKLYDNPLISQSEIDSEISNENNTGNDSINVSNAETQINDVNSEIMVKKSLIDDVNIKAVPENDVVNKSKNLINSKIGMKDDKVPKISEDVPNKVNEVENQLLKSILNELDDPEFDLPKSNKYFVSDNRSESKDSKNSTENIQLRKKFIIESDEETNGDAEVSAKKKKRKKRKLEDRALQFSDEEDEYTEQEEDTYVSDLEDDNNGFVEYDSEENEVEIQVKAPKKKRIGKDFFEQEAELTSEDEWVGSGDEDEAGLDRMEREEGDDDTFHQGKLQRELGEIHMREVLDQDKREVRLLQELLFEDGDLGDGHRQRKFRWKNADGEEEMETNADEYVADTQEDEFESEEQWRKQRHEREMFLRKLQEKDEKDSSVSINRSALIKATLVSKTSVNITENVAIDVEKRKLPEGEKKTVNDVPLAKEPFIIFQQSYHNSLLTRGRGALARLAALATPLAGDGDDAPKVNASSSRGNFVFAAITPDDAPKVTKRKADANPDTPRLLKKMRKQDSSKNYKTSLLDHL